MKVRLLAIILFYFTQCTYTMDNTYQYFYNKAQKHSPREVNALLFDNVMFSYCLMDPCSEDTDQFLASKREALKISWDSVIEQVNSLSLKDRDLEYCAYYQIMRDKFKKDCELIKDTSLVKSFIANKVLHDQLFHFTPGNSQKKPMSSRASRNSKTGSPRIV